MFQTADNRITNTEFSFHSLRYPSLMCGQDYQGMKRVLIASLTMAGNENPKSLDMEFSPQAHMDIHTYVSKYGVFLGELF